MYLDENRINLLIDESEKYCRFIIIIIFNSNKQENGEKWQNHRLSQTDSNISPYEIIEGPWCRDHLKYHTATDFSIL